MKQKLDKVLNKLYMPGQDQIIGGMSSNGFPHNVIRGAQQTVEMNHGVELEGAQGEGESEDSPPRFENHGNNKMHDQEWAQELRKADERSHEVRLRCEDLKKSNQDLENKIKYLEESMETRDVEILRLG